MDVQKAGCSSSKETIYKTTIQLGSDESITLETVREPSGDDIWFVKDEQSIRIGYLAEIEYYEWSLDRDFPNIVVRGRNYPGDFLQDAEDEEFSFLLDMTDHSGRFWAVHGTGYQCEWDTTQKYAFWKPNPDSGDLEDILSIEHRDPWQQKFDRRARALEFCKAQLEELNAIESGDVWMIIFEEHTLQDEQYERKTWDAVHGVIGYKYAMEEVESIVKAGGF